MIDPEAVRALQEASRDQTPSDTAKLLRTLIPRGLDQGSMTFYFGRAFPGIPLRVLLDAYSWNAVGVGTMTDLEFDDLLSPWWPPEKTD
jgi:hypothetical protein